MSTVGPLQPNGSSGFTPSSTTSWTYNSANQMTQQTTNVVWSSGTATVVQPIAYDSLTGSLVSIGAHTSQAQQFGYDKTNRVTSYTYGNTSPANKSSGFAYDGLGRLSQAWD